MVHGELTWFSTRVKRSQGYSLIEEGDLKGDTARSVLESICDHAMHRHYTRRQFDILGGFEFTVTRCINCHKTIELEVKKLD